MYPKFNSFSTFMGLPDSSPLFLSQKDFQFPMENDRNNIFFRPALEFQDACQVAPSEGKDERVSGHDEYEQRGARRGQEQDRCDDQILLEVSSLKVKLPSVRDAAVDEDNRDGCKTPTSEDHKIPQVCPPPPRKPRSDPSTNKKGSRRRVFLDLSNEIESLFPPALLADFGHKIKKVRKESLIL